MLKASTSASAWVDTDYSILVAAHLLRDRGFLSRNAILMTHVADVFFGHYALRDLVKHGVEHYLTTGELLPAPALLHDLTQKGGEVSPQTYTLYLERIFAAPLEGGGHVQRRLQDEVQRRMLSELDERREDLLADGRTKDYFRAVREIEALGEEPDAEISALTADLAGLLANAPTGISTGFAPMDACLDNGGICPGELFLVIGDPNIGKTQFLHHLAREAMKQDVYTFVLSLETSHRNTRLRILRGATGWTRDQVLGDPAGFRDAVERLGPLPLHVRYAPAGGYYSMGSLETDIDRVQQETGRKVGFVVRDYGELMAAAIGDWREIRKSYLQFKGLLGRLGAAGADATQCNAAQRISNYDLLKDADIGLRIAESSPGSSILDAEIVRIREGHKGVFQFRADRPTGIIELNEIRPEDTLLIPGGD